LREVISTFILFFHFFGGQVVTQKRTLDDERDKVIMAQDAKAAAEDKVSALQQQSQMHRNAVELLKAQMAQTEKRSKALVAEAEEKRERDVQGVKKQLDEAQDKIDILEREVLGLKGNKADLEKLLDSVKKENSLHAAGEDKFGKQCQNLKRQLDEAQTQVQQLTKEVAALKKENSSHAAGEDKLGKQCQTLKRQLEEAQDQLYQQTKEATTLKADKMELDKALEKSEVSPLCM